MLITNSSYGNFTSIFLDEKFYKVDEKFVESFAPER